MRAHARAGVRAPEVYVLISRVTDPQNLMLTGLPPKDLWEDISQLWLRAGINIDDAWKRACSVTNEWVYEPGPGPLRSRIRQRIMHERSIPLKNRSGYTCISLFGGSNSHPLVYRGGERIMQNEQRPPERSLRFWTRSRRRPS